MECGEGVLGDGSHWVLRGVKGGICPSHELTSEDASRRVHTATYQPTNKDPIHFTRLDLIHLLPI